MLFFGCFGPCFSDMCVCLLVYPIMNLTFLRRRLALNKPQNSEAVLNETQPEPESQGESGKQLDLTIHNIQAKQHGEVYVCEASTSYPRGAAPARAEFILNVACKFGLPNNIALTLPSFINILVWPMVLFIM